MGIREEASLRDSRTSRGSSLSRPGSSHPLITPKSSRCWTEPFPREDTALKAYFKQQGLSQEEADQAIAAYKQQKAANQPDVAGMQAQLEQLQSAARKAQVETEATLAAAGLGLDAKAIPYVLRMADFSQAAGQDGKVDSEAVKTAINKVLEDVPALKPQTAGGTGFIQVGAGGGKDQASEVNTQLDRIFGVQKK